MGYHDSSGGPPLFFICTDGRGYKTFLRAVRGLIIMRHLLDPIDIVRRKKGHKKENNTPTLAIPPDLTIIFEGSGGGENRRSQHLFETIPPTAVKRILSYTPPSDFTNEPVDNVFQDYHEVKQARVLAVDCRAFTKQRELEQLLRLTAAFIGKNVKKVWFFTFNYTACQKALKNVNTFLALDGEISWQEYVQLEEDMMRRWGSCTPNHILQNQKIDYKTLPHKHVLGAMHKDRRLTLQILPRWTQFLEAYKDLRPFAFVNDRKYSVTYEKKENVAVFGLHDDQTAHWKFAYEDDDDVFLTLLLKDYLDMKHCSCITLTGNLINPVRTCMEEKGFRVTEEGNNEWRVTKVRKRPHIKIFEDMLG